MRVRRMADGPASHRTGSGLRRRTAARSGARSAFPRAGRPARPLTRHVLGGAPGPSGYVVRRGQSRERRPSGRPPAGPRRRPGPPRNLADEPAAGRQIHSSCAFSIDQRARRLIPALPARSALRVGNVHSSYLQGGWPGSTSTFHDGGRLGFFQAGSGSGHVDETGCGSGGARAVWHVGAGMAES